MSIEINGTPVDLGGMNGGVGRSLRWADLALKNANTRIEDTALYVGALAAIEEKPMLVSEEELQQISDSLDARRTKAELQANDLKARADLLGINRGGVGYPEL